MRYPLDMAKHYAIVALNDIFAALCPSQDTGGEAVNIENGQTAEALLIAARYVIAADCARRGANPENLPLYTLICDHIEKE